MVDKDHRKIPKKLSKYRKENQSFGIMLTSNLSFIANVGEENENSFIETFHRNLQLTRSARKEGNLYLASRQLLNHFEKVFSSLIAIKNADNGKKPYNILLEAITNQSTAATTAIWSVDNTDALLELSKLAYR